MSTKKTIAKSFTVSTIEDGVSVQAQYAPNANPTSGQIHTVWQNGDLYMRTRESDESAWSSWHKIVGESGDETDFSFGISQYKTTANASTAPSDISSWSDAPLAVNTAKPYLWAKVQQKSWNASTQAYVVDSTRYIRLTGEPGTSPYFADLNNEMDAIQCKHDGSVIADQTVSTVISMWKGSAVEAFVIDNIYRNGTQLTWDGNNNGVWPRSSGSTVSLEFTTSASIADIDDFKITIHSYNDNTVTRELHFTINGVRANAIYRLVPSHSQIVKKKDGTYVPSGNVTCSVEKTENGSTSTPSSSEYTLEKSVNGGSYTTYSATAASSITSDLKFRLTVGGVVVDLETIPLVSDGNKGDTGDSAPAAFANPAQISIPCYSNGNVKAQKVTSVIFSLKVGTNTATVTSCADGTKPTGVTVQGQANNAVTITVGTSATASGLSSGVTFTVTGTYGGKTYSATVTVALIGSTQGEQGNPGSPGGTGPRGKIGRFFYYAGEFDSSNTTQTFVVNDAQAPYFSHGVNASTGLMNCHVYNPTENGTFTMAQMWANSSQSWNNAPWEVMTNDFKYLITQAIFGQYAHLGSFIVNGDWLISQYGTINGSSSTSYTKFYPEFIHGCSLCKSFDVDVNYIIAGSAYFIGGKTYYIKVSGSSFSSGCQLNVRMYNGSSNVGATLNLTSSSPSGTITFEPTTSGTYYLRAYCQSGGMTAKLTAYVDCFVPNYAVDGSSGKTYQTQIYASGGLRSPFTYMTRGGSFTTDFNDNVAVYSGSETSYSLPWDASQSGRKVVITNYYWNGNYSTSSGFAKITAPSGKYFYEDGITKSTLKLSREAVELLGYGDANNFYGWVVLKRIDLGTVSRYGHHMKMLASGRVTGSSSGASVSYHTFDGTTMSVTRDDTGIYTLSWSNNNWYADAGHVFVMVCGYGVIDSGSNPLYASVKSQTKTSITVQTADDDSRNDGAFNFFLMNFNDWIYL